MQKAAVSPPLLAVGEGLVSPMLLPAFLLPKGEHPLLLYLPALLGIRLALHLILLALKLEGHLGFGARVCGLDGLPSLP